MISIGRVLYIGVMWGMLSLIIGCGKSDQIESQEVSHKASPKLFELLTPGQTNVSFSNTLTEGLNTNILMYEYFYNGGGVAVGDFDLDGFEDLYFTSNMEENKLYLNNGDMTFRDITGASGAGGRPGPWKTGVNVVDMNGDGLPDIYVCYSGALPDDKRKNQLFINQGVAASGTPTFIDQAEDYGVASPAFSTQSYFFDYDRDGDLDMILLNHNPKNLPLLNEVRTAELLAQDDPLRGLRLFRQSNGTFTDVTTVSGINGSALAYGLGVGISDFNNDGWPDFYVSNDYSVPDYLYVNQGDGNFQNELQVSIGHISQFSMGNDVADINDDGHIDILTLDMLPEDNKRQKLLVAPDEYAKFDQNVRSGFYYQYMRNMLQLNNGNGTFSEIGQYAGISNTDWSWSALLADYNNDGHKDLYVTNGYRRDYTNLDFINYMDDFVSRKGRLQRQDVMEIISHMPSSEVANYAFAGGVDQRFEDVSESWGVGHTANSNGAAYTDLDNDGDLDLVVNNINAPAFVYQNQSDALSESHYLKLSLQARGLNSAGIGSRILLHAGDVTKVVEQHPGRGYQSSVSPILHFGLGDIDVIDSIIVQWPDGSYQAVSSMRADTSIVIRASEKRKSRATKTADIPEIFTSVTPPVQYVHPKRTVRDFDRQQLLLTEYSNSGPCLRKGDLNNDGLEDLFIGGSQGQSATLYRQQKNGTFTRWVVAALERHRMSEDGDAIIFDANGDEYLDIYVASGGYHLYNEGDPELGDRLYINDGTGGFSTRSGSIPAMTGSNATVIAADIDNDGDEDLFVGGRVVPGRYPESPQSYILINDGSGKFTDETLDIASDLSDIGMVTDALWTDVNQDNQVDLIVVGEWVPVTIFVNNGGVLEDRTRQYLEGDYSGYWNTISSGDVNKDGQPDFIIGNIGTNTQIRMSDAEPARIHYGDFDENGSIDPVLTYYINGVSYPFVTRDELLKQLASYRSEYTSYESYAMATSEDVLKGKEASIRSANYMYTSVLISTPDDKYEMRPLPKEAQYAPVYCINVMDVDGDSNEDLLIWGNNSRLKLRIGQVDANYGMLFKGDGSASFEYIDQGRSGLKVRGDVRSVLPMGDALLIGINQEPLQAYQIN